jgi:energy-coupling factor transport system ATP-binding protein
MGPELKSVGFTYLPGTPMAQEVLRDIDLELECGEIVCLMGRTGAGKSTLLQILGGLLIPRAGEVILDGERADNSQRGEQVLRQAVGILMQSSEKQLFAETVEKDVAFGPRNQGLAADELARRVTEALHAVGMDPESYAQRSPFSLSGGEMRRAALAGVLAMRPRYLLLDEPASGLDYPGRQNLHDILMAQRDDNKGILVVTHDWEEVAVLADRVLLLRDGRIPVSGTKADVIASIEDLERARLQPPPLVEVLAQLHRRGLQLPAYTSSSAEAASLIAEAIEGAGR